MFSVRIVSRGERVRRAVSALVAPSRAQPGCLRCELLNDPANPATLELVAEWSGREDLDRYLRSEDCRRLLAAAELADEAPAFRIDTVARREGIEAIAAARSHRIDLASRSKRGISDAH
jgi:quinol monooxygenase YgiN